MTHSTHTHTHKRIDTTLTQASLLFVFVFPDISFVFVVLLQIVGVSFSDAEPDKALLFSASYLVFVDFSKVATSPAHCIACCSLSLKVFLCCV